MEGHGLEFFINQEKVYLKKKMEKMKIPETNMKSLVQMLEGCGSVKANKFLEGRRQNLALDDNSLNCIEYVQTKEWGPVRKREDEWIGGNEDVETEEAFEWMGLLSE